MNSPEIDRLIGLLAKLPGLGPRSARRAALRLLQQPEARMLPLATALADAARAVGPCSECGNLDSRDPCAVCTDPARDRSLICVVEGVGDLWALERAAVHRGLYHVLGGTLSALGGVGPEDLNVRPLMARVAEGGVAESHPRARAPRSRAPAPPIGWRSGWHPTGVAVSRVGHGVPIGGALDVLDDGTLGAALKARRPA